MPLLTSTVNYQLRGLALAVALPLAAHAQAEFQPGYVVPAAGDTLRGEIDFRDAYFNSTQCRFRSSPTAVARTYRPGELLAYGLPAVGRRYRTLVPPPGPAACFAEVLVSGPASLYSLRDADGADHYYLEAPQFALTELVSRRATVPGQTFARNEPVYRLTLQQAMPNCPRAEAMLGELSFTETALRRVVTVFNECQGVVAAPAPARPRQPLRVSVLLGGQLAAAHFKYGSQYFNGQEVIYGPRATPVLGVGMEVPLTALSHKLSLAMALLYERDRYEQTVAASPYLAATRYALDATYLRLPVLARYTFPRGTVRPLLELGPTLAYAVQLRNTTAGFDAQGNATTAKEFYPDNFQRLQEGVAAGAGVRFAYYQNRAATLLVRAETDTGWLEGVGLDSWSRRLFALLTFDLTK